MHTYIIIIIIIIFIIIISSSSSSSKDFSLKSYFFVIDIGKLARAHSEYVMSRIITPYFFRPTSNCVPPCMIHLISNPIGARVFFEITRYLAVLCLREKEI